MERGTAKYDPLLGRVRIDDSYLDSLTDKATPVDTDKLLIEEVATGNLPKKLTWANLKNTVAAAFNLLYLTKSGITGGQKAIGGSGVTDKLQLQGTSGNGTSTSPAIELLVGNAGAAVAVTVLNNGNTGLGVASPVSVLDLKAGTASVAPLGLNAGPILTTPLAGKVEFDGTDYFITI